MLKYLMILVASFALPGDARAALLDVEVSYDDSKAFVVKPENPMTFADLVGTTVTGNWRRDDGTVFSESFVWVATSGDCGGVSDGDGFFRISGCGDTEANVWEVSNSSARGGLFEILIDVMSNGSVFDVTLPSPGTFDSGTGQEFKIVDAGSLNSQFSPDYKVRAIYGYKGSPLFDLWGTLLIQIEASSSTFPVPPNFGVVGNFSYLADTDPPLLVPLPAGLWLTAGGVAALGLLRGFGRSRRSTTGRADYSRS